MKLKDKSPLAHADVKRASKRICKSYFSKLKPPSLLPHSFYVDLKSMLVQLGARGLIPRRFCTSLINLLGLREV